MKENREDDGGGVVGRILRAFFTQKTQFPIFLFVWLGKWFSFLFIFFFFFYLLLFSLSRSLCATIIFFLSIAHSKTIEGWFSFSFSFNTVTTAQKFFFLSSALIFHLFMYWTVLLSWGVEFSSNYFFFKFFSLFLIPLT